MVEHDGLTVVKTIGNIATGNDNKLLALVTITEPTSKPWLTLRYDKYINVMEWYIKLLHHDAKANTMTTTVVREWETVFIPGG